MRNQSVMTHAFDRVPSVKLPRSVFNRSHGWKATFDTDWLIPFYVDEAIPGDSFNLKASILLRLNSPTIRVPMDNLWLDIFYFAVPNRILWDNFTKFFGEKLNPSDSTSFTVPQITSPNVAGGGIPIGHLFDYMGLPVGPLSAGGTETGGLAFNNLHGRAYNDIWNTWFRDTKLQNSVTDDRGDGPDTWANYNLLKRGKRHDYFTAAFPYPQSGATQVSIPLGTSAVIKGSSTELLSGAQNPMIVRQSDGTVWSDGFGIASGGSGKLARSTTAATTAGNYMYPSNLFADLSTATSAPINSIRSAFALQQFLEVEARTGLRFPEILSGHFGVVNPDSRMQRPELLGTYSSRINVTVVPQTASKPAAGTTTDLGTIAGFGTGSFVGNGFFKSFTEPCVLIGLLCVRADLTYQQGMDKMWDRRTRYDFYWPEFAHIGEGAIKNKEIYANLANGTAANQKDGVWGYIPPFEEYRFKTSKICGQLRSYNGNTVYANTLDLWHFSEAFSAQPTLGATFIQQNTPLDRCISVPSADHWIADVFIDLKCARVMPVFGVPGLNKL